MKIKQMINLTESGEWWDDLALVPQRDVEKEILRVFDKYYGKKPKITKKGKTETAYATDDGTVLTVTWTWDGKFVFYVDFKTKGDFEKDGTFENWLMNCVYQYLWRKSGDFQYGRRKTKQQCNLMSLDASTYNEME